VNWLENLPIKRKLTLLILTTCTAVLLLACLAIAAFELFNFRRAVARDTTVLADILAKNTQAALSFDDENSAWETLLAFQAEPHIVTACLYRRNGNRFADYTRAGAPAEFPARPDSDGYRFQGVRLVLFRPVILNDKRVGTIYLQNDLQGMYDRLRFFGIITGMVLIGSLLVALVLSSRLQRPISGPILALAETARRIAERNDYSVRAVKQGHNELGVLTDAFNQVLVGIQERERDLRAANDALREENAERKRAEAARAQFAAIVESSDDAILSKTLDGIITSWNRGAERLFGYSAKEAIGQSMLMLFPPERAGEEPRILARIKQGESIDHFETVRVTKNGKLIDVSVTTSPIRGEQGKIVGASNIARDITERKLAEMKLREQMGRLNLLQHITRAIGGRQDLQSILQVVIRSLEDNLPIDFSCVCSYEQAANLLRVIQVGVGSAPLAMELAMTEQAPIPIDQNGLSRCVHGHLVYEPDTSQVQFPFPQRLARGGLRSLVIAPLVVESKVFGVLVAARRQPEAFASGECEFLKHLSEHVALASHQSELYGALQQAYDDLRQTQQTVMQQERLRALGQMASGIAHDINNAISPIALYTESLLEKEPNLSSRAREYLETIRHAIEDVAQTVARMREFYRQRETQLTLVPVRLNPLVQQVVDLTRARWRDMPQQRGLVIEMKTELAPDQPPVKGVESEIREALINLIFNAVDAMPNGGTLTLRTTTSESGTLSPKAPVARRVHIEITDTGVGMDEETRRRCLEPFFTTKGERGTGLGLAMVYGIVQRHGAEVEIQSAPGKGTTMRLTFLASDNIPQPGQPATAYTVPLRLRILVVDDDPMLIKSLRDTLEIDGHQVVTANNGQSGIDAFLTSQKGGETFAVVITDLGMPYVDGRKVASAIKAASPSTPIILLTGWGQRLVAEGAVPVHVDRVLNKPPKLRELREALAHCCPSADSAMTNS